MKPRPDCLFCHSALWLISLLVAAATATADPSSPIEHPPSVTPIPVDRGGFRDSQFEQFKAETAIRIGLDDLAIDSLRAVIAQSPGSDLAAEARMTLAEILLSRGDIAGARSALDESTIVERNSAADLLRARIFLAEDRVGPARRFLSRIEFETLPTPQHRGWYHLANAIIAERTGNPESAREAYTLAFAAVADTPFESRFRVIAFLNGFRNGALDPEEILQTQSQLESSVSPPIRAQLFTALGLSLYASGEEEAAVETLRRGHAEFLGSTLPQKHLLTAAYAYTLGIDNPASRPLLREILTNASDREILRFALDSLLRYHIGTPENRDDTLRFLNELPALRPDHPLLASIRYAEGFTAAAGNDLETALDILNKALNAYPENAYALTALDSIAALASAAAQRRTAADAIIRSLALIDDPAAISRRWRLVGDLYYLNRDFANAADAYRQASRDSTDAAFAEIAARIANRDLSIAAERLDTESSRFDPDLRWEAEWNLSTALIRNGRSDEAISRIRALAEDRPDADPSLLQRLSWLQIYALLESGRTRQAANLARVWRQAGRLDDFDQRIRSLVYLLEGQAFYDAGDPASGDEILQILRAEAPGSEIAVLSLLVEARFLVGRDEPVQAIDDLVQLSELYPKSEYAPVALFEAGLLSATLRTDGSRERGFQLLDRIITDYPTHYLAFHARYRMGELLLARGNFTGARVAFEKGRREFPDHPDAFFLDLGIADATLANPDATPEDISRAATRLRILAETAAHPVPVRIESAVKRAHALERIDRATDARTELWDLIQRNAPGNPTGPGLPTDPRARFWLTRAILSLADSFRRDGDTTAAQSVLALLDTYGLPGHQNDQPEPSRPF